MGMWSKYVIPARSSGCTFLFIIPGQVSVVAEFPNHSKLYYLSSRGSIIHTLVVLNGQG
jgi:hypothetical protein